MTDNANAGSVAVGMAVQTSDGESLGTVSSLAGKYVVATDGALVTTTTYIPTSAVAEVDAAGTVRLGVTGDHVRAAGWNEVPGDFHAGATVPEVAGRDNLEAAAEHTPTGRTATAAIREDERSA